MQNLVRPNCKKCVYVYNAGQKKQPLFINFRGQWTSPRYLKKINTLRNNFFELAFPPPCKYVSKSNINSSDKV